ncbi:hypothetical protein N7519_011091 [Penicillium mononematosum]|uniref:uncharacterized protein n=1 Tax=Penicillium mononematosum TaxID=268346 RepID=UPI0025472694|nr:uncharacterized protein N7519_011091 [Penicillium mononematosum]KAJ6180630.1 hypothetical protein N7519_011091 [Penicillium mononematosum]
MPSMNHLKSYIQRQQCKKDTRKQKLLYSSVPTISEFSVPTKCLTIPSLPSCMLALRTPFVHHLSTFSNATTTWWLAQTGKLTVNAAIYLGPGIHLDLELKLGREMPAIGFGFRAHLRRRVMSISLEVDIDG